MPAMVIEAPLGIRCVFSDGRRAEYHLDDLPSPRLARDLATGLADLGRVPWIMGRGRGARC